MGGAGDVRRPPDAWQSWARVKRGWPRTDMSDDAPLWIDTDAEGRIVNWARDALSLTGYSEPAVVGHSLPLMLAKDRLDPATYRHIFNGHSIERIPSSGRRIAAGSRCDTAWNWGRRAPMRFRAYAGRSC